MYFSRGGQCVYPIIIHYKLGITPSEADAGNTFAIPSETFNLKTSGPCYYKRLGKHLSAYRWACWVLGTSMTKPNSSPTYERLLHHRCRFKEYPHKQSYNFLCCNRMPGTSFPVGPDAQFASCCIFNDLPLEVILSRADSIDLAILSIPDGLFGWPERHKR